MADGNGNWQARVEQDAGGFRTATETAGAKRDRRRTRRGIRARHRARGRDPRVRAGAHSHSLIAGVSAGAIVASAFASGSSSEEIEAVARTMRFSDLARWQIRLDGLVGSDPMTHFLQKLLKVFVFEKMRIPLAVVASDLTAGAPAVFRDKGDVVLPIRASCSYPGLFQPVRHMNHCLVDGMVTMDVPAAPLRRMGATHVVSVSLPMSAEPVDPHNILSVVTRCFQIMTARTESQWRRHSNVVIVPEVRDVAWDAFDSAELLIAAGERAANAVMPQILRWLSGEPQGVAVA